MPESPPQPAAAPRAPARFKNEAAKVWAAVVAFQVLMIAAAAWVVHQMGMDLMLAVLHSGAVMLFVVGAQVWWKNRTRGELAIGDAMRSYEQGESDLHALQVASRWGQAASGHNRLLRELQSLREIDVLDQVHRAWGTSSETESAHDRVLDTLSQGILVLDETSLVIRANGAAGRLLQQSVDAMVGVMVSELVPDQAIGEAIEKVAQGLSLRTFTQIWNDEKPDAATVLRFVARPMSGGARGAVIMVDDVTQQVLAEQSRHTFIAQATHELRTPLTNVGLYLERLIEIGEADPSEREKCLNVMNEEVTRLGRVVQEVLSVSEMEAGAMAMGRDDVRVDALLRSLKSDFTPQAQAKSIEMVFDLPPKMPVLQGDREKIGVALQNLVGNALKYTPQGGRVDVIARADGQTIEVTVRDTGIGIAEQDQERVFEKFSRAEDARVATITGSGLGLALAREVARRHGGDITLQSVLDEGSTFTLMLPAPAEAV